MLILGCGNAGRGDDAAGVLVARRLRESGIAAEEFTGDGLTLAERWRGRDEVTIIDAVITGRPCGTVSVWEEPDCSIVPEKFVCSSHGIGLAHALRLSRTLGWMPVKMRIYGIEGVCFDRGSAVSERVLAAVERVTAALRFEMSDRESPFARPVDPPPVIQ